MHNNNTDFVHLHIHTDDRLKDSTVLINSKSFSVHDLVKEIRAHGMTAAAITDHSSMGGVIEFYKTMNCNALKPIIGCELNFKSFRQRDSKTKGKNDYHLTLLAQDYQGYQNLCSLCPKANIVNNAIDKEFLSSQSKGLIALSGCIQGELPSLIINKNIEEAEGVLSQYLNIFGKNNLYIELMDHGFKEQKIANKGLLSLAEKFRIPIVATNNVHYLKQEENNQYYFKSYKEMFELFKETPEALSNTMEIAERCNICIPI